MPCQTPHLDETSSAAPGLSPGIVTDDEWLLRSMFVPDHFDSEGQFANSVISLRDLKTSGFSVNRLRHITQGFVESEIDKILVRTFDGKPRRLVGIACLKTSEVREIEYSGAQLFVVIDIATPDNTGHAAIYFKTTQFSDSQLRKLREALLPLLCNTVSVDQAFSM